MRTSYCGWNTGCRPRPTAGSICTPRWRARISQIGQEIQLLDDDRYENKTKPSQRTGSVYSGIAPEAQVPHPAGEWNAIEILAQGKRIRTTLNGVQLYDARLDDATRTPSSCIILWPPGVSPGSSACRTTPAPRASVISASACCRPNRNPRLKRDPRGGGDQHEMRSE